MENKTISEAEELLAQVSGSRNAGLVAAAQDPLWLWPVVRLLAAVFMVSFEVQSAALSIVALLTYLVGVGAVVGFVVRRRGVQPSFSSWTGELKMEFVYYSIGATLVAAAVVGLGFAANFYFAAVAAFFAVSIGGIWYHLRWRDAVDRLVES